MTKKCSCKLSYEELKEKFDESHGNVTKVSDYFGIKRTTMRNWLIDFGILIPYELINYPSKQILIELYEKCGSVNGVARHLGIKDTTLYNHFVSIGIDIKSVGFSAPKTVRYYGSDHYNWKGGIQHHSSGYIMIYMPDHPMAKANHGYVMEHRLVMEESLGRYLTDGEIVHHINENKIDNRLENLELMTVSEHISHHKENAKRDSLGKFSI